MKHLNRLLALLLTAITVFSSIAFAEDTDVLSVESLTMENYSQLLSSIQLMTLGGEIVPQCDCGNGELALISHADNCAEKGYFQALCEKTAEEIYVNWSSYDSDQQEYVLTYMSWNYLWADKLAELKAMIETIIEQEVKATVNGYTVTVAGKMPKDAVVSIIPVSDEMQEYLNEEFAFDQELGFGGSCEQFAFDLTIMSNGEKWQPTVEGVEVTLSDIGTNASRIEVVHLLDSDVGVERTAQRNALRSIDTKSFAKTFAVEKSTSASNGLLIEELSSDDGEIAIHADGSVSFTLDSFSILQCTKITEGLKDLKDNPISLEEYNSMVSKANGWANSTDMRVQIGNWKRSSSYVKYTLPEGSKNIDWNWDLVGNLELDVTNPYQVWNGSRVEVLGENDYYSYNPTHYANIKTEPTAMDVGQISVLDGVLYDSAAWNNKTTPPTDRVYTIYRLQGEFVLPNDFDTELWDYNLNIRVAEDYVYINDDLYVFIYPKSADLSSENFVRDFFAYWGGTSARDGETLQRTFHNVAGQTCNRESNEADRTPLAQVVDGWRVIPTPDNVGATIRKLQDLDNGKYKDEREYVIDIFVSDYSGWGAFYRPVIEIEPQGKAVNFQAVCEDHASNGVEGAGFDLTYTHDKGEDTRTDISDENGYLAYSFYAGSRDMTLTATKDIPVGFQAYTTSHTITLEENDQFSVDGDSTKLYGRGNPYHLEFAPEKKTLSFDYNGGTDGTTTEGTVITYCACGDVEGVVPTVTREGYTFGGWKVTVAGGEVWPADMIYTSADMIAKEEPLVYGTTETATLQALWIEDVQISYQAVVFGVNDEIVENTENTVTPAQETIGVFDEVAAGSVPTAETPTYKFVGWYTDEACTIPVDSAWVDATTQKLTPAKTKDYSEDGVAEGPIGYEAATYYAKFQLDISTLTITKTGMNSGETAIFTVVGTTSEGEKTFTVAVPNGESVTIGGLIISTAYSVTEVTDWSWRYTSEVSNATGNIAAEGSNAVFTNSKAISNWLDDEYGVHNDFSKDAAGVEIK